MKKIVFVVSTLRICGPINQLYGIVSNLDLEKYEPRVLTLAPEPEHTKYQDFVDANIPIDTLGLSRVQFILKGKSELKKYLNRENPDVIHTTGVRVDSAVAKLGFANKQVMSIRNYAYEDYLDKFGKWVGTYFANDTIKAIEKSRYPVCCSYSLKELYSKHVKKELEVVQNGVDIKKFTPPKNENEKVSLREQLQLPKDKRIFIVVGSLIKRKDPLTIIKAFKQVNKNQAVLVVLGEGELMDECKSLADESILLKGNVSNVTDYLKASDLYISASYSEGLPNSVLEAGRTGIEILLSDIPQHREVFMHGYPLPPLFEAGDLNQLANEMKPFLNKSFTINHILVEYIEKHYSTKTMSQKYQDIYELI